MRGSLSLFLGISVFATQLFAVEPGRDLAPDCMAYGRPIPVNNAQILHFKRTTPNQFRERGHIEGAIVNMYENRNGHLHFAIQIGKYSDDTIEVIYNEDFGAVPELELGMPVEACGDYITSTDESGPYPASPDGAIIHWVHANPKGRGHDSGYLLINGNLCGQDISHAPPKPDRSQGFLEEYF